jgi:hypothetical protein
MALPSPIGMENVGHALIVGDPEGFNSLLENFVVRLGH